MHGSTSESSECDLVLLELLTLVASRNTTFINTSLDNLISNRLLLKSYDKENNATGHFSKDNCCKWCTRLDNGELKLNNKGNQVCSLWAATRMYLHNSQTFLPG